MLNHQLILTNDKGFLLTTLDEPTTFNSGTPTKDGKLCIADKDADVFVNGLGYVHSRSVCTVQGRDGPLVTPMGRLRVRMFDPDDVRDPPPRFWLHGLPFDHKGDLCIARPDLPSINPLPPTN